MTVPYSSFRLSGVNTLQHPKPRYTLIHLRQANCSDSNQVEEDKHDVYLSPFNFNPTHLSLLERVRTRSSMQMMSIGAIPPEAEPRFFFFKLPDLIFCQLLRALQYLPATVGQPLMFYHLEDFPMNRIHFKIAYRPKTTIALKRRSNLKYSNFFKKEYFAPFK